MTIADASMIHEEALTILVQSILKHFDQATGVPAETGVPYLLKGDTEMLDVTAVIGVTGDLQGCIYYTASNLLLDDLLGSVGEQVPTDELRCDMCDKVANEFAGNARRQLGPGFMVSLPVVFMGQPEWLALPKNTSRYVIPILWQQKRSLLIVCLENTPPTPFL